MVSLARDLKVAIESSDLNAFGEILHENWCLKKSLVDGISDSTIDDWYTSACRAGATGGKLLGAGSGGFLMFFAPPDRHDAIAFALQGLKRIQFGIDQSGSQIVFYRP
jgi:D-glycero-alpha-D-manno-heptose-7-phosphate kinase